MPDKDFVPWRGSSLPVTACGVCESRGEPATVTWKRVKGQTVCGACYDKGAAIMLAREAEELAEGFDL